MEEAVGKKMIRAFIFDFDGTLMDTEILWVEAAELYLRDRGSPISHDEAVRIVYGRSWLDVYNSIVGICRDADRSLKEMEAAMREYMVVLREGRDVTIPGSVDLLRNLAREYPVCIVSGSSAIDLEASVDELGIRNHLEFLLAAEDYGPGKPDPTCFLLAAGKLGIPAEECLVFEDSAAGIEGAKRAGMKAVALIRPGLPEQDVSEADLVLPDLSEFTIARAG